jgi:DNA-binding NarL/FixJ family response regulator
MATRILILDHQVIFRTGLSMVISSLKGIEVVAEASSDEEALRIAHSRQVDLVIMNVSAPNANGVETIRLISQEYPSTHILVLSLTLDETYMLNVLRAGAEGFITNDVRIDILEEAIHTVAKGETYVSQEVSRVLVNYIRKDEQKDDPLDLLTPRQREILPLIAEGLSTQKIALKLNISVKTVEVHRYQIMERLKINDLPGLVRYAVKKGLIQI